MANGTMQTEGYCPTMCAVDAAREIRDTAENAPANVAWIIQNDRLKHGKHLLPRNGRFGAYAIGLASIRRADHFTKSIERGAEQQEAREAKRPVGCASEWDHELGAWRAPSVATAQTITLDTIPARQLDSTLALDAADTLGRDTVDSLASGDSIRDASVSRGDKSKTSLIRLLVKLRDRLRVELSRCGKVTVADPATVRRTLPIGKLLRPVATLEGVSVGPYRAVNLPVSIGYVRQLVKQVTHRHSLPVNGAYSPAYARYVADAMMSS